MRLLPRSLFGRLVLLLLTGLVLAQLLSTFILLRDRGQVLYKSIRESLIIRTAGVVRLLDTLPAQDRQQLIPLLASPELQITLSGQPVPVPPLERNSALASKMIRRELLNRLPQDTEVRISIEGSLTQPQMPPMHRRHMMGGGPMSGPWDLYARTAHHGTSFSHPGAVTRRLLGTL